MLGHNNISTTQIYARITNKKIEEDMDKLSEQLDFDEKKITGEKPDFKHSRSKRLKKAGGRLQSQKDGEVLFGESTTGTAKMASTDDESKKGKRKPPKSKKTDKTAKSKKASSGSKVKKSATIKKGGTPESTEAEEVA